MKKIMSILILCLSVFGFISCTNSATKNEQVADIDDKSQYSYYIDNYNNLVAISSEGDHITVDDSVVEFRVSDEYLVYTKKIYSRRELRVVNKIGATSNIIDSDYKRDFILNNEKLFLVRENELVEMDLSSDNVKSVSKLSTPDIYFHSIDDDFIMYSHQESQNPELISLDLKNCTDESFSLSFRVSQVDKSYAYGLNESLNMCRLNLENGYVDVLDGLSVVKYFVVDDFIVYLDNKGVLTTLSVDGKTRIVAENVKDFVVFSNRIYYLSGTKGVVYETDLKGYSKEVFVESSSEPINLIVF